MKIEVVPDGLDSNWASIGSPAGKGAASVPTLAAWTGSGDVGQNRLVLVLAWGLAEPCLGKCPFTWASQVLCACCMQALWLCGELDWPAV